MTITSKLGSSASRADFLRPPGSALFAKIFATKDTKSYLCHNLHYFIGKKSIILSLLYATCFPAVFNFNVFFASDCGSTWDCKAIDKTVGKQFKEEMVQQLVNDFALMEVPEDPPNAEENSEEEGEEGLDELSDNLSDDGGEENIASDQED